MGVVPSLVKSCAYAHHVLVGNHDLSEVGDLPTQVQIPWAGRLRLKAEPPRWLRYAAVALFETRGVDALPQGKRKGGTEIARVSRVGPRDVDEENREPRAEAVGYNEDMTAAS